MAACLQFAGAIMCKLKINCVQRLPRGAEDLAPDIVELWIGVSRRKVDINIVRRGFILADPVMHAIRERIKRPRSRHREYQQTTARADWLFSRTKF